MIKLLTTFFTVFLCVMMSLIFMENAFSSQDKTYKFMMKDGNQHIGKIIKRNKKTVFIDDGKFSFELNTADIKEAIVIIVETTKGNTEIQEKVNNSANYGTAEGNSKVKPENSAPIFENYVFADKSSNCHEQLLDCRNYSNTTAKRMSNNQKSKLPKVLNTKECYEKKSACNDKIPVSVRRTKKAPAMYAQCHDIYAQCIDHNNDIRTEVNNKLNQIDNEVNFWGNSAIRNCEEQNRSCEGQVELAKNNEKIEIEKKRKEKEEKDRLASIKQIVSQYPDLGFKYIENAPVIDGLGEIKFGFSEDEIKMLPSLMSLNLDEKRRRVLPNSEVRTVRELTGKGPKRFELYDDLYPVHGKNRQVGALYYNGDGAFGRINLQQVNLNLSGDSFEKIADYLKTKYPFNGDVKFKEFLINSRFAVFNNGQVILWKNDLYKVDGTNVDRTFHSLSICPELQLIYSTPDLGEHVWLEAVLKKAVSDSVNTEHEERAKKTKNDLSTL